MVTVGYVIQHNPDAVIRYGIPYRRVGHWNRAVGYVIQHKPYAVEGYGICLLYTSDAADE